MSEKGSERSSDLKGVHRGTTINHGSNHNGESESTKEDDELLRKNIKHMKNGMEEDKTRNEETGGHQDVGMEDEQPKEKDNPKMHQDQEKKTPIRSQISYKTKLLGGKEKDLEKDFDSLMKE